MTSKKFEYTWKPEIYLLHLQFDLPDQQACEARITRANREGKTRTEVEKIGAGLKSHRIMVSRSHPSEVSVGVEYPGRLTLEVYELDDRAYFPTEAYFVG